ncbi:MAG: insulinase family protein [Bacteroidales bacterium]|jgi:predicted Zn-dependent peptidase|nr:insulinase family protein [Bacteroidales bacterium]
MKKLFLIFAIALVSTTVFARKYKSWANDPMNVLQYTLPNGLQIWMSVNHDEPRVQTLISVRVGAKNDPLETTGMAHYFEHIIFKGTANFGTLNWEAEKVLIDAIEAQFEKYRTLTDSLERAIVYHVIDSLSYEASKYAIPNEYQKMMSAIGSQGTNAFTSYDYTMYRENVPSNQLENWAKINADRFAGPVLRLFHTEIEAVYEEKNMSLTNDGRTVSETILETLFPHHPYGIHNVLGTREHLKNPSMTNLKKFYADFYVPNNMAIILTGDFDPDEAVDIVEKYFGQLKPSNVPALTYEKDVPPSQPIEKEVTGLESESVSIAFAIGGDTTREALLASVMTEMLSNGKAGLFDVNLKQKQKVMSASAYSSALLDYGTIRLSGTPKQNQTIEEVRDLMLEQLEKLKRGEFEEWLLKAAVENARYGQMKMYESMYSRAMSMAMTFITGRDWEDNVKYLETVSKITKDDIVDFARKHCGNNYVVVYKRKGESQISKINKPAITPVVINRDTFSAFFAELEKSATQVKPIEPQFIDYNKDIVKGKIGKNIDLYYAQNTENATFSISYRFEMGSWSNKIIGFASSYLRYLGTSKYSLEEIQKEFYKIACNYNVGVSNERITISVSGLAENFEKAVVLLEHLLADCKPDETALKERISDILKSRKNSKNNQRSNFNALNDYACYGENSQNSPGKYFLSEEELSKITPQQLVDALHKITSYEHCAFYYGPLSLKDACSALTRLHKSPKKLLPIVEAIDFVPQPTDRNTLVFAQYNAKQAYCANILRSEKYDRALMPVITLYNQYFSGSMGGITFQELRERRSLAYSSGASFQTPRKPDGYFMNMGTIITQNDKVAIALATFDTLYNDMPLSEKSFNLAKEKCLSDIRTSRARKLSAAFRYLDDKKWGYTTDSRKIMFEMLPSITLKDIDDFRRTHLQNQPKTYTILGDENEIDWNELEKLYGTVKKVTAEEIFGY